MRKLGVASLAIAAVAIGAWLWIGPALKAQEPKRPVFKVEVGMVVLSFTVTDSKNRYINNLKPKDFRVLEDGIPQKIATFAEGNKAPMQVNEDGTTRAMTTA